MSDILSLKFSNNEIADKRETVSRLVLEKSSDIKNKTISTISTSDLKLLFLLYDKIFLNNWFRDNYKGKLKFSLSRQMTKSAGLTRCPKNINTIKPEEVTIEIKIGVDFFFHYDLVEGSKTVGGVITKSSLEALQLVFEHELCHVIEFIIFFKSDCSKERFKRIAGNLFGHTESCHKLPTRREIVDQKFGLRIGDRVSFAIEGKRLDGVIYAINKRATVMVSDKDGIFQDSNGKRYSKYYVPLELLK